MYFFETMYFFYNKALNNFNNNSKEFILKIVTGILNMVLYGQVSKRLDTIGYDKERV